MNSEKKNVIIKSLITSDFWSSKTSQHTKPPNDAYSNLGNNKNNKSVLNEPPEKDPTVDFHVEGNNILNQNKNHQVLPDSDKELDILTSISDKKSSIEILNKQKEQPVKAQGTINKEIENLSSQQKKSDEKRVFIVGDSIIKNVNGYDVSGKTEQCRVYIRQSLGVKVRCMKDHINPVIRDNLDHIIFHIGTNDVPSDKSAENIAKSIVELALSAKSASCDVSISNIVVRKDGHQNKCQEVNDHLKEICVEKNINLIDHSKNIKPQHLNKSRLHLTKKGTSILSKTFIQEIRNTFQ